MSPEAHLGWPDDLGHPRAPPSTYIKGWGGRIRVTSLLAAASLLLSISLSLVLLLPRVGEALPADLSTKSLLRRDVVDPIYLSTSLAGP